ncbi:MAG: hypothetical protein WA188_10920 [Terriglobales bacterium]
MADRDRYSVFMIEGSNPEKFFLAFIPEGLEAIGSIVVTSEASQMTESEMREYLAKRMNRSAQEIEEVMQTARAHPRPLP